MHPKMNNAMRFHSTSQTPIPGRDDTTRSFADVTITIRDINDEPPTFNQQEYSVTIPENVPYGTPLANLNMEIKDTDTGTNSVFKIELKDPIPGFIIEPQFASGHTAVSLKINKVKSSFPTSQRAPFAPSLPCNLQ